MDLPGWEIESILCVAWTGGQGMRMGGAGGTGRGNEDGIGEGNGGRGSWN